MLDPKPIVLVIDDKPDAPGSSMRLLFGQMSDAVEVLVEHPEEVTEQNLIDADLVLVDYKLEDWPDRENAASISLKPLDGLALAAVLRSHATHLEIGNHSPTAFALHTGIPKELSGGLPTLRREHAIAHSLNLEWFFSKDRQNAEAPFEQQLISLASSVKQLPPFWSSDNPEETQNLFKQLLAFPKDESWAFRAWEDVEDCHPPTHELSSWSHGLALLRWLLHRILPYPCFLMNSKYLAARLRVTHSSLLEALSQNEKFLTWLEPAKYKGILDKFLGDRWWRSGIESLLWNLTKGNSFDPEKVREKILSETKCELETIETIQPVICLDKNFLELEDVCPIEAAIRIQPDDWPPYAEQAWTTIELATQEPSLEALIMVQDKEKLRQKAVKDSEQTGSK